MAAGQFECGIGSRRAVVALGTVVLFSAVAGCAAYPFVEPTCGPGEHDIGTLSAGEESVQIKGTVTAVGNATVTVDDGTGSAQVRLSEDVPRLLRDGKCVIVRAETVSDANGTDDAVLASVQLFDDDMSTIQRFDDNLTTVEIS
ncbi:hypothetical protein Hrd1104_10570 [Halorhabdus sp. CBA1104]|uniref:OB-fold nucleic acid binding domain-containing protein n=1 Tax=Halorhabdus sp. CBA1104 TaxID=1380432 RepID=UPI0012B2AFB2|nr:OB-fold nucleic acid binding domain-containing protein [Halorhabdus sp. CBA1104]QGN07698.1 hypothetical protein Hrd1104_10570 [Halorhabdus sp. CBA1104]